MERVRRMYASYDAHTPRDGAAEPDTREKPYAKPPEPSPQQPEPERQNAPQKPASQAAPAPNSLLDALMKDKDQSLILLLLVLMMRDGADMNLMLALMYILI